MWSGDPITKTFRPLVGKASVLCLIQGMALFARLFVVFFLAKPMTRGCSRPEINLQHNIHPRRCSENSRSLTFCTAREFLFFLLYYLIISMHEEIWFFPPLLGVAICSKINGNKRTYEFQVHLLLYRLIKVLFGNSVLFWEDRKNQELN